MRRKLFTLCSAASLWLCVLVPTALASQQPGRKIEGELSGNLFFGNTQQVLASTRAEFERADSGSAFRTIGRFNYGETTTDLTGTIVSKRSWNAGSNSSGVCALTARIEAPIFLAPSRMVAILA